MIENDLKIVKILIKFKKWGFEEKNPFVLLNQRKFMLLNWKPRINWKKLKLKQWESSFPSLTDYSEIGAHQDRTATSSLEKSLLEFGFCKSWAWIFHRLLQGTWSKNSSNGLGSIRLYKALKNKGCECEWARGNMLPIQQGLFSLWFCLL